MARKKLSPDEEIQRLEQEAEQLRNRMNRAKARKLDELEASGRKDANRLKVLTGVAVQQAVKAGELEQAQLDGWLDKYLGESDRAFVADQRKKAAEAAAAAAEAAEAEQEPEPVAGDPQPAPQPQQPPRPNEPATYQQFCQHYGHDLDDDAAKQQYQQYLNHHPGN